MLPSEALGGFHKLAAKALTTVPNQNPPNLPGWERDRQRNSNNLIDAPAREDGRAYRHLRIAK
jgi:hypothetical protein